MRHTAQVTPWGLLTALLVVAVCSGRAAAGESTAPGLPPSTVSSAAASSTPIQAVAMLMPMGNSGVHGVIRLTQQDGAVALTGKIMGLTPGKHAFHVHEFGDLTDTKEGKSAGDHYNPQHHLHGRPEDQQRHAGDFGNIEADRDGVATIEFRDPVVRLAGPHSVIGRSLVVHAAPDKFTQPSGDAGPRVAIGVIGIAKPQ